jgi:GNAT superfamily N-acetyltransferase
MIEVDRAAGEAQDHEALGLREAILSADDVTRRIEVLYDESACALCSARASVELVRDFCVRQSTDAPHDPRLLSWLAGAFGRILDGDDARAALRLPASPAHRRRGSGALQMHLLAAAAERLIRAGINSGAAEDAVAESWGCTSRTVQSARSSHDFSSFDDDRLTAMAAPVFVRMREHLARPGCTLRSEVRHFFS